MKKRFFFLLLLIFMVTSGCGQGEIRDNQVYVVEKDQGSPPYGEKIMDKLNTEGRIPFQEYQDLPDEREDIESQVLLTIAPDGKSLYYGEPIEDKEEFPVIKGPVLQKIRLYRLERETGEKKLIIDNIPFISMVKWNPKGTLVAFGGGKRLIVYDPNKDKLLLENELEKDAVDFFFWSPKDENKLYSEQGNLANGAIYYVDSQKKVEAYENREEFYFKGKLDNNYYYATKWYTAGERGMEAGKKDMVKTIVVDQQGNTVKVLAEGRFRDSYKKSLIQVGEGGFGLYYTANIDQADKVKTLTKEYVYDAKFVADGKIAYIIANKDLKQNNFLLHLVDQKGNLLKKMEVMGSSIALLPDGKTGYLSGPRWEKVDFTAHELISRDEGEGEISAVEKEKGIIVQRLRRAVDILYRFELAGEKDWAGAKEYFTDSHGPEQWAYFDLTTRFKEGSNLRGTGDMYYKVVSYLQDFKLQNNRASAVVRVEADTSSGGGMVVDYALELIKEEDLWKVTGFSTFPNSSVRRETLEEVAFYVQEIKEGKYFPGKLDGKEIEIGQLQFWRSSMPHLAPNGEEANLCKVFLKVKEKGQKETIYKLLLDKKNQNYWKPVILSNENLGSFY